MTQQTAIKRLFNKRLREASNTSFIAKVKDVNADDCVCVVETEDGIRYDEVLLCAVTEVDKGILVVPKVGSHVMVSRIGGSNELYVSMFSEITEVMVVVEDNVSLEISDKGIKSKVGDVVIEVTDKGVSIANKVNDLKTVLSELIDAVSQITVTAPPGTTGGATTPPINATQITAIKAKLDFLT